MGTTNPCCAQGWIVVANVIIQYIIYDRYNFSYCSWIRFNIYSVCHVTLKCHTQDIEYISPQPLSVELNHLSCLEKWSQDGSSNVPILAKISKDNTCSYCCFFSSVIFHEKNMPHVASISKRIWIMWGVCLNFKELPNSSKIVM